MSILMPYREFWQRNALILLVGVITLGVYGQVASFDYLLWDDDSFFFRNPNTQQGLTWDSFLWAWRETAHYFIPITRLSFLLDVSWFGLDPGASHLMNLAIHLTNILLLYHLLVRMTGERGQSLVATALFALHPLRVEAVVWIVERKELLAAFFGLLAMLQYLRYTEQSRPQAAPPKADRTSPFVLSLLFFLLSILAKPMWITLPCLLLLLDWWPLNRLQIGWKRLLLEKFWFLLLTPLVAISTVIPCLVKGCVITYERVDVLSRLTNLPLIYLEILGKTLIPTNLAIYYPPENFRLYDSMATVLVAVSLAALTGIAWWVRRGHPAILVGWLWFLGCYMPVSGLISAGTWPRWADRWTYLPHIGLFIALTWSLTPLLAKSAWLRPRRGLLAAMVITGCAFLTWQQADYWRNTETIFKKAIASEANSHHFNFLLGRYYARQDRLEEAFQAINQAIRQLPQAANYPLELGHILMAMGRFGEAMNAYNILMQNPFSSAADLNDAGSVLLRHRHPEEAIPFFKEAILFKTEHPDSRILLIVSLLALGRISEAASYWEQLQQTEPADKPHRCTILTNWKQLLETRQEQPEAWAWIQNNCPSP